MKDQTSTTQKEGSTDHDDKSNATRSDAEKSPYSFTDSFEAGVSPEYREYRERGGR